MIAPDYHTQVTSAEENIHRRQPLIIDVTSFLGLLGAANLWLHLHSLPSSIAVFIIDYIYSVSSLPGTFY